MVNHHLRTFIAAADSGSFIKAGERLFISPNAVTKQINLLEAHLDLKLFERTRRGLVLTPEGKYIYKEAAEMIARSDEVIRNAHRIKMAGSGIIRVGTSLINAYLILHERWMRVADRAPDLTLQIEPYRDDAQVFSQILLHLGETIDVIPCLYDEKFYLGKCNILHLDKQPARIGVPVRHPLSAKAHVDWKDLDGETIIMHQAAANPVLSMIRQDIQSHCPSASVEETSVMDYHVFNRAVSKTN